MTLNLQVASDSYKIALAIKTILDGSVPGSEAVQVNCRNAGRWGIPEKHETWYMKGESKLNDTNIAIYNNKIILKFIFRDFWL